MKVQLFDADVEKHIASKYGKLNRDEQGRVRARLHNMIRRAEPGNHFWHLCEEEFGWEGDHTPADHGMNWGDNK